MTPEREKELTKILLDELTQLDVLACCFEELERRTELDGGELMEFAQNHELQILIKPKVLASTKEEG